MYMCIVCLWAHMNKWRQEDNLGESVLSFDIYLGSMDQPQVSGHVCHASVSAE